jgi:hypothetical protein
MVSVETCECSSQLDHQKQNINTSYDLLPALVQQWLLNCSHPDTREEAAQMAVVVD